MAKYLISFPSAAMVVPDGEWGAVGRDAHAVIDELGCLIRVQHLFIVAWSRLWR